MGAFTNRKKIVCRNSYGYEIVLSYLFPFFLSDYSGLHESSGTIASSKSAFSDGVTYMGTSANERNINLVIAFKDDDTLQAKKEKIYNIFSLKDKGTLYYYEGDIIRKINYQVENVTLTRNANCIFASVNLLCPYPFFTDSEETKATLNNWDKLLEFPLEISEDGIEFGKKNNSDAIEIINNSHINYGLKIIFSANGTVENPKLTNTYTNETMQINQTMLINEKIVVKTYDNQKSIIHINAQGEETNITHKLVFGTNFLKAPNGINRFTSTADTGSSYLEVEIDYYNYYEAV